MPVDAERDARIGMPQLSLSYSRRRPDFEQETRMCVAKRMESAPLDLERVQHRP